MFPQRVLPLSLSIFFLFLFLGCEASPDAEEALVIPTTFADTVSFLEEKGDCVVLKGDGSSAVIVSPALQGRVMTMTVGSVASTGFVNFQAIHEGEVHPHFNNFGGIDRFWIGPEAGPYGIYFEPGAEFNRDTWQVPAAFDKGPFPVSRQDENVVVMQRDMEVTNWKGAKFKVRAEREVGVLRRDSLTSELGLDKLPANTQFAGCYTNNRMTNVGESAWDPDEGLIGIWVLGQFLGSSSAVVIAPFQPGEDKGPAFNDDYFGKVSEVSPERIQVVGNAVCFRGDASRVGKFGLSQQRTTGIAGSYDFGKNLLTVVKFTVPETPERYGNSAWVVDQKDPYGGDTLQSYNNGVADSPGELNAAEPFYEIESTSPVRPLAPNESVEHRHATFQFHGPAGALHSLAKKLLGVDLDEVRKAMGL